MRRIGVDLLGSDSSPDVLLNAAVEVAEELPADTQLVLFGLESSDLPSNIEFVAVSEEITMDDSPLLAVRRKRDASIPVAMRMLREKEIDGLVSLGNTGALVASATMTLPMLPGIDRPGLLSSLPSLGGSVVVIDIGANVNPKPHQYLQFARLGEAYQRSTEGIIQPRIGLLNIGTERMKGRKEIREAYELLQSSDLLFSGNIEGRDVFRGEIEVLVCDGFSGNIFLKTAEGISMFILDYLREAFGDVLTPQVEDVLSGLNRRFNYAEYPGALVSGVEGVVVKCHGFSSKEAIKNGIRGTLRLAERALIPHLKELLS